MVASNYFVAIKIPEDLGEKIKSKIDSRFSQTFIGKAEDLSKYHLTVKFFGELLDEEVLSIIEKLEKVSFSKFNIRIGRLGLFEKKFGSILWLACLSKEINSFVKEVWSHVGWSKRKFKAHVTLFRIKKILDVIKLKRIMDSIRFGGPEFEVSKFYLMKSELLPEGSKYSVVREFELK